MYYCQDASREMLKTNKNSSKHGEEREQILKDQYLEPMFEDTVGTAWHFPVFASHQSSPLEMQLMTVGQIM